MPFHITAAANEKNIILCKYRFRPKTQIQAAYTQASCIFSAASGTLERRSDRGTNNAKNYLIAITFDVRIIQTVMASNRHGGMYEICVLQFANRESQIAIATCMI